MIKQLARAACLIVLECVAHASTAPRIPVETFYRSLAYPSVVLSPSGRYFAALYPANGTTNLAVVDIATMKARPLTAFARPTEVTGVGWDTDERLIYEFDAINPLGFRAQSIAAVNRDGKNPLMLVDNVGSSVRRFENVELVDLTPNDAKTVLIASDMEKQDFPSVYEVETSSAWHAMDAPSAASRNVFPTRRIKVVPSPGRKCSYVADNSGVVRLCTTLEPDGSHRVLYRADAKAEWTQITGFDKADRMIEPIAFTPDNNRIYVLTNRDRDTIALYELNPQTGKLGTLIYAAPDADLSGPVWSSDHRKVLGVNYHTDAWHTQYFEPALMQLQKDLHEAFPGDSLAIMNFSGDGKKAIVLAGNERTPGKYYLYDAAAQQVSAIAPLAPWIDPKQMSPMQAITYKARDGLEIHGYLTTPAGRAPQNLPLILYPHGGPMFVQDTEGWDRDVQFLASRGYAVLQMNFRGSGGAGSKFREAGNREWGGKMLDDITDAALWAAQQGIADAKRVCIFGASYGGYAALMGAATRPDLFRCAISYAGVTDLESMYDTTIVGDGWVAQRSSESMVYLTHTLGERRDAEFLRKQSPVYNAANINCPVLIAHGRQDVVVQINNAHRMRDALESAHKVVEYLEKPDEGHGFHDEQNLIELATRIEQFLQKYNPPD